MGVNAISGGRSTNSIFDVSGDGDVSKEDEVHEDVISGAYSPLFTRTISTVCHGTTCNVSGKDQKIDSGDYLGRQSWREFRPTAGY